MKSIEEIIQEIENGIGVSLNYAFRHSNKEQQINLVKNVAEKYAKQVAEAQREACGRCEALNKREDYKGVHSLAVLKTRLVTDNI